MYVKYDINILFVLSLIILYSLYGVYPTLLRNL